MQKHVDVVIAVACSAGLSAISLVQKVTGNYMSRGMYV
jgi:cellobiose-specific phosphotransferase system component IIB